MKLKILITGAGGYLGSNLVAALKQHTVLACDIKFPETLQGKEKREICDVRDKEAVHKIFRAFKPDVVVHLASIVTPGKKSNRDFEYSVDVLGSMNVLAAAKEVKAKRLVVTSSGAAYGYHKDNPMPLKEEHPLRGNKEFAYAYHKRLVEELLAKHVETKTKPEVVIFRIGTILGENTHNQITALFEKSSIPGIRGSKSPFVFIWDKDVVHAMLFALKVDSKGKFVAPAGAYNLAGDGVMDLDSIAQRLHKPVRYWSATFLKVLFSILKPLRLSRYGKEQVRFLEYRPVLDNTRLKKVFGFKPQKTSREAFEVYCASRGIKK
ncbi:MAG: hypothetical protein LDLANPLL_00017 [Turneriella sp.]|nr:hypothetical protein [Turneriella sp.]